jgi:hypothetical protein
MQCIVLFADTSGGEIYRTPELSFRYGCIIGCCQSNICFCEWLVALGEAEGVT